MKRKWYPILLTAILTALCLLGVVGCAKDDGSGVPILSATEIQIEIYDDYTLEVSGADNVTWESSDPMLATVENGVISAQGRIGNLTVTARAGKKSATCNVFIIDSGIFPELVSEEQSAFVGVKTPLTLPLWYNENYYYEYTVLELRAADETVVTCEDGMLKGLKEGETTAHAIVEWKDCEVETYEEFTIKVYPSLTLMLEETEYTVYDVNESSSVRSREAEIEATVYRAGAPLENATLSLRVAEGEEYLETDGMTVRAKACGGVARQAIVEIAYEGETESVTQQASVRILPNYVQRENGEFTTVSTDAEYALYDGEVGGRTGVYRYFADEDCANGAQDWVKWGHHLELQSLKTRNNESRYPYMVNECGYAMVSFDVYYEGQYNETSGEWEYRGISANALYGINSSDNIYYVNHVKNVPERLIVNGDKVTNNVLPKTWLTVYVDLREAFKTGSQIDVFLHSCRVNDSIYVDNIRFWYDDASVAELDRSGIDLAERALTQDDENSAKYTAGANEWMAYSPAYAAVTETDGVQSYSMQTPAYADGKTLLSEGSQRRFYPVNVYNGKAVKERFAYLSFEYKLGAGRPVLFAYDVLKQSNVGCALTGRLDSEKIFAYKEGKRIVEIPAGEWVRIVVELDVNIYSMDTVYFTSTTAGTAFEVRGTAYYKNDSCKYEFGYDDLLEAEASDLDFAVAGEGISVSDLVFATYKGGLCDYTVKSVTFADEGIASYADGTITLLGAGETTCEIVIAYGEEECTLRLAVLAYASDVLMLPLTRFELYCGDDEAYAANKTAEIEVERLLADGKNIDFTGKLRTEIVRGENVVSVDGLTLTAIGEGEAAVKVYYTKEDGSEVAAEVTVIGHTGSVKSTFVLGNGASTATYGLVEGEIAGRTGVYSFSVASDIWNNGNKLSVKETDHLGGTFSSPAAADDNMRKKGYAFITFDFCMSEGASFYTYSPNGNVHTGILLKAGSVYEQRAGVSLVKIYDRAGRNVTAAKLSADTWYTMLVEYDYDKNGGQYSCVQVVAGGVDQTVYLADPICYYKDPFKAVYQPVTQTASEAWGLIADSANSFENGVLTLSKDVWNDYLVLRESDGRKGTNPELTTASEAVANMAAKNYNVLTFTISVSSGTARVYAPTTGTAQAYVTIGAGTLAYSDTAIGGEYIEVYAADGTRLQAGAALTADTAYTIRILYNTANTGWGEVAIKGAATTATLGGVTFSAD